MIKTLLIISLLSFPPIGNGKIYHKDWIDLNKNGRMDVYEDPSADLDARVEDLLSQMSIEEKTCQMVTLYGFRRVLQDDLPTPEWKKKLWKDGIGAIDEHLNGFRHWGIEPDTSIPWLWPASNHAWAMNKVQSFFIEETRLGIPVDFTNEGIRGVEAYIATNFPTQLGIGHTWDRELVRKVGEITGREARLLGYTNIYAPILDVGRDQRWGRYEEVYGEDPWLVGELGTEMVLGMQKDMQVAATGKHFVAYSNNKGAREGMARVDPQMAPHELENIHIWPWRQVISRAGMLGVMSSYNDYDGIPVQGSCYWLTERLRDDLGFKGYVVSDSDAVEYLHSKHHTSKDMKESVYQAVMAGLNVRCTFRTPDSYVLPLRRLIAEEAIPMEVIDERVRDILRVKFLIGLFDRPYQLDYEAADAEVNSAENNEVALRASRESLVLLKNDGTLPLDGSKLKKIAVIGPNADETSFVHTHYGPLATKAVSVLEGLRTALDGKAEVAYAQGCALVDDTWPESELIPVDPTQEEALQITEAAQLAAGSDVAVVVLGGGVRTCGENKSRSSLDLPGHQDLLLKQVLAAGKPVIVVLINGRPLSVNRAARDASAILEAWYPGSHGGTAIAEVLLGDYNPGGKLTVTFPKSVGQIPFNFPYKPNSQVDGGNKPGPSGNQSRVNGALYAFGHGLSYTSFEYSDLHIDKKTLSQTDSLTVSFNVKNTGQRAGEEVVQLYLHDRLSSITVYEKQLRGFDRVALVPGEERTVTMTLPPVAFSLLDAQMNRVIEPGVFDIMIGASSTDIRLQAPVRVLNGAAQDEEVYPDDITVRKACFPVALARSEDVTLPVREGKLIGTLTVGWDKDTDCKFEILFTNGGGQFLPLYKGSQKGAGVHTYTFEVTEASEIRIIVTEGRAVVKSMDDISIQK